MAAKVKRPPAPAKLVPVERMPGGLWKLPVEQPKGVVEIELNIAGNYMNGIDFSVRSEPVRVTLPMTGPKFVHLDLKGRPILSDQPSSAEATPGKALLADSGSAAPAAAGQTTPPPPLVRPAAGDDVALDVAGPLIPWWFAGVLGGLNVLLGFSLWWLVKPEKSQIDLAGGIARLRSLAGIETVPEDESSAEATPA